MEFRKASDEGPELGYCAYAPGEKEDGSGEQLADVDLRHNLGEGHRHLAVAAGDLGVVAYSPPAANSAGLIARRKIRTSSIAPCQTRPRFSGIPR